MPYYRIYIQFKNGSSATHIRFHISPEIEFVFRFFQTQVFKHYAGKIEEFDVKMIPKNSKEVKAYKNNKVMKGNQNDHP